MVLWSALGPDKSQACVGKYMASSRLRPLALHLRSADDYNKFFAVPVLPTRQV